MIERRLTFFVLWVCLTVLFVLLLRAQGWAEECPVHITSDVNPQLDAKIAACEKRNFQRAVNEALAVIENPSSVVVDKETLRELIKEAERPGERSGFPLSVFVYEYDDEKQWWNRARPPVCLARMEQAMRFMSPYIPKFVDPEDRRKAKQYSDNWGGVTLECRNCPVFPHVDKRSLEERLADERYRYEREQENRGRQIVEDAQERWAYQEWESVKAQCWRKP